MKNTLSGLIAFVVAWMPVGVTLAATPRQIAAQLDDFMRQ